MKYVPRTRPRKHQNEAQHRLELRPHRPADSDIMAWLMEMGTGKSKVVLDEWGKRVYAGDTQDLLVIAPAGSYLNWCEDKSEAQPSQLRAHLAPELYDRMISGAWKSGAGVVHKRRLEALLGVRDRPRALFVNTEALSTVKMARDLCADFLSRHSCLMAVDESTSIKNPDAERTKYTLQLGEAAAARRILTGLVTPRSPLDLFSQFEFLDWRVLGFRSFYAFRNRYAIMRKIRVDQREDPVTGERTGGREVNMVVGYRNLEELQQKIAPYSYRVLKKDCLDLPPKIYAPIRDVALTNEQHRLYKEIRSNATALIAGEDYVTATMVLTQMLRLHQVLCGHVVDEEGKVHDVPTNRVDQLLEVLGEHSGKAIIWCSYDHSVRMIVDRLRKEFGPKSVAAFWGGNRSTRGEEEQRWLGDPECNYLVSTQQAGGRGNTWICPLVVYFSNTDNLDDRLQSEDRAHRDGLQGRGYSVTYVDLMCRGTVDEKFVHSMRDKLDMATTITGENYREWLI